MGRDRKGKGLGVGNREGGERDYREGRKRWEGMGGRGRTGGGGRNGKGDGKVGRNFPP